MNTFACVYRSGGHYDQEWVKKLRDGAAEHLDPDRFVCLTDVRLEMPGVEVIALHHQWPRWWSKIELFRPGLFFGPVLYVDLDSMITGNLTDLVRTTPGFTMVSDFYFGDRGWHNSSVMSWRGDYSVIYDLFRQKPASHQATYKRTKDGRVGDQAFIEDALRAIKVPVQTFRHSDVVSYKQSAISAPPDEAKVIQFHGSPKPDEAIGWPQRHWKR